MISPICMSFANLYRVGLRIHHALKIRRPRCPHRFDGDVTIVISKRSAEQTKEILSAVTSARNCFFQAREFVTSLMRRMVIRKMRNIRASESQAGSADGLLKRYLITQTKPRNIATFPTVESGKRRFSLTFRCRPAMLNSGLQDRILILRGDGCGGQEDLRRVHIAKAQGTGDDAEGVCGGSGEWDTQK